MATTGVLEIGESLGFEREELEPYGAHRAKVRVEALERDTGRRGRYVLVTAVTPTPLGEGKTVTTIGLSMALAKLGHRAAAVIRQSALGPTLGLKGGGAGGGAARVEPLEEALLGLGADFYGVESANNLLAAMVDDALMRGTAHLDPHTIDWHRVIDMNDRALRRIVTGLGGPLNGRPRETGFDIVAASEVMAILAMARDPADLRRRLGAIVVGFDVEGKPVTAEVLRAAGAMAALLREAFRPNLMRTGEGTPVIVHTGPFGNLAHGCSSVVADRLTLPRADYLVTEAGFGAELGGEKFMDLKCGASGLAPDVAVVVATIRALKVHSGNYGAPSGARLPDGIEDEDVASVAAGCANLTRQIENVRTFGVPVVVAVNRFPADTAAEIAAVREAALAAGAVGVAEHTAFRDGSRGAIELAEIVERAVETGAEFRPLYRAEEDPRTKVERLATTMYGAAGVSWSPEAERSLDRFVAAGYGDLPICVAKTHLSLSHDPALRGAPRGFTFPVREVRLAAGAGYLHVLAGDIMTMPGLPPHPHAMDIDVDARGVITGLT